MQAPASKAAATRISVGRKPQTAKPAEGFWIGPGNVATFVRCLRLLDLDLRDDWPGVHEQLFSAKSSQQTLQQRVKCVEWSLYRLFESWDPAYTKDVRARLFSY
jgi:HAUS augmin-like complex subunit 6 N-terminus